MPEFNITPTPVEEDEKIDENEEGEKGLMPLTVEQEKALEPELVRDVEKWRMRSEEIGEELKNIPKGKEADELHEEAEILQERYYDLLISMDEIEPIVETDEGVLKEWEELGLREGINNLILGLKDQAVALHALNFEITENYVSRAEKGLKKFMAPKKAGKFNEKVAEIENNVRKSILAIAFEELGVNPNNLELIKEEKTETGGNFKYYKTNRKDILLSFDGTDWWIEKKKQIH